jgi:hypothetical protein
MTAELLEDLHSFRYTRPILAWVTAGFGTVDWTVRSSFPKGRVGITKGGDVSLVMFEDVDGMEVFVNPEHVIWVREYPGKITVISCGHDDKFAVRLSPIQTVAVLGKPFR